MNQKHIDETNKWLSIYLENAGYIFWETYNIEYEGQTISYRKEFGDFALFFAWHWEQEFDEEFWVARLCIYRKLYPDDNFRSPTMMFEIDSIVNRFLEHLPEYETRLINSYHASKQ